MNKPTPLLVILPGLDGSAELHESFCEMIQDEQQGVIIGYPADRYLNREELVVYAEARIPEDRPIILMGISFSGPVTARLLARKKRNYVAAIFCTTFVTPPHPFLLKATPFLPLQLLFPAYRISSLVRFLFFEKESSSRLIRYFQDINRKLSSTVIAKRVESLRSVDERQALEQLTLPCCYIQALNDHVVPSSTLKYFRRILDNIHIFKIDGPHAILLCRPEKSWQAIKEFLVTEGLFPPEDSGA